MSDCIRIYGLEHLEQEQTLLINYTILCSGLWELSQLQTAYRGICDDSWIVMYPNHQHPRHTDFPISVGDGGAMCSFAWNYGGIPSVGAENFDSNHSYLVQLTIFNRECGLTGQPGTSGSASATPTSTEPYRQNPTGGGGTIRVRPGLPAPPWPGHPPGPGGPTANPVPPVVVFPGPPQGPGGPRGSWEPTNPVQPAPGPTRPGGPVITPTRPRPVVPPDPTATPRDPVQPEDPSQQGGGGGGSADPTDPLGIGTIGSTSPTNPIRPWRDQGSISYTSVGSIGVFNGSSADPQGGGTVGIPGAIADPRRTTTIGIPGSIIEGTRGTIPSLPRGSSVEIEVQPGGISNTWSPPPVSQDPRPFRNLTEATSSSANPRSYNRPNSQDPGGSTETRVGQTMGMQSQAVAGYTPAGGLMGSSDPDVRGGRADMSFASLPGSQDSVIIGGLKPEDTSMTELVTKLDTSAVIPGSITMLELSSAEVKKGESVTISGVFLVPHGIEITGYCALYLIDTSKRSSLITVGTSALITTSIPGKAAISIGTGQIPIGASTVVFIARGPDGKVIGVASRQLVIRPIQSALPNQGKISNNNRDFGISSSLRRIANLSDNYISFNYIDNTAHRWFLTKTNNSLGTLSALVSSDTYSTADRFSIAVYPSVTTFAGLPTRGDIVGMTPTIKTTDKIRQDGYVYDPDTYNAGFMNVAVNGTVLLEVIPAQASYNDLVKTGRVYISYNYQLRPISVSCSTTATVTSSEQQVSVTITGSFPYASQNLGLCVNGRTSEYIPPNYTVYKATTDKDGSCTWTGVTLAANDFVTIFQPISSNYNPYKNVIFVGQLQLLRGTGSISITSVPPASPTPGTPGGTTTAGGVVTPPLI